MSVSKVAQNCEICNKALGIYSCPRCSRKYCSSRCYKSPHHKTCSESFYREWVGLSLHNQTFDETEKSKMVRILKKSHEENEDEQTVNEPSIVDRFAGLNIDNVDEDVLWQNLSQEEKDEFKALVDDEKNLEELLLLKQPWWTVTTLNLVSELDDETSDHKDDISPRPYLPLNVKKLSNLTSKKPSECLQYNLINILYAYAFLYRFYNCDLKDFLEDAVDLFFKLSPVLSEGKNYQSLEESVQDSIRLILISDLCIPVDFAKSIASDISSILQGPNNAKPSTFVLCALHDIEILLLETKTVLEKTEKGDKTSRKRIMPAVKKIEYFMSWTLDFEDCFSNIASDLLLFMLPELFTNVETSSMEENIQEIVERKPLIQEMD